MQPSKESVNIYKARINQHMKDASYEHSLMSFAQNEVDIYLFRLIHNLEQALRACENLKSFLREVEKNA